MKIEVEYTDTFGGEPNFSWVERAIITVPSDMRDREIVKKIKASVGLTGINGRMYNHGDFWEFKPYRNATIMRARILHE